MRKRHHQVLSSGILALGAFLSAAASSQSNPADSQGQALVQRSPSTLRTNSSLVIVDVVATDNKGRPVSGLGAEDFTVLEDGAPQKIIGFSFQQPDSAPATPAPPLAPGVVTNVPQFRSSCLNVILIDAINGDFAQHAFAKDQILKYLGDAPASQPIAVFALGANLSLVHDFTTDTRALGESVLAFNFPAQPSLVGSTQSSISAFEVKGAFHTGERGIQNTLKNLYALAGILSGYPGRKNLIWVSEGFPLNLFPDTSLPGQQGPPPGLNQPRGSAALRSRGEGDGSAPAMTPDTGQAGTGRVPGARSGGNDYAELVKKVADALMKAQVAVYPIDSAGVTKDDHLASKHTVNEMAERTGGLAFRNRNDIGAGIRKSIEDGSTYYTLAYYPENRNWDGQFRTLELKTARPNIKLRYRLGYYGLDPATAAKEAPKKIAEDFSRALTLDAPAITSVQFKAAVMPPSDKSGSKLLVNFAIDPHTLGFEKKEDGLQHASVSCVVWAYSGKGDPVRSEVVTRNAAIKSEVFEQSMKSIFPCQPGLNLKPGHYTLRLGVLDRTTNQIGTTSALVTVQ